MKISKYLKSLGYDTVGDSFYRIIDLWMQFYKGYVRGFHNYKMYNGSENVGRKRYSLKMGKKVCEDIADMLLNEKVLIIVDDGEKTDEEKVTNASQEFVNEVLNQNRWWKKGNEYQEKKAACGTVGYVCMLDNAIADDTGKVAGGDIKIRYVMGNNVFPLTWENGYVSECGFVFRHVVKGKAYNHVQLHILDADGTYIIENHVVEATQSELGSEIPYEKWGDLKPFKSMAQRLYTGSNQRQFVIDTLNIANNVSEEEDSPMGVAIFANAIDDLKSIDVIYDSYVNEFVLGKKRVFVSSDMLKEEITGQKVFDPNDVAFYRLPEEMAENAKPIIESNMELRSEEHNRALNDALNIISVKTGFGTKHYQFESGNLTTATQVISENSDMFRTLKKHELVLDDVLKELVGIILRLGVVAGAKVNPEATVRIAFDDSIIEDKNAERERDRAEVAMGAMRLAEYRAKWYGESMEEAEKNIVTDTIEADLEEE